MALPVMQGFEIDRSRYDEANEHDPELEAPPGLSEEVVRLISRDKREPEWMLQKRLEALRLYEQTPFPDWGPDLSALRADMNSIKYFVKPKAKESTKWEDLPEDIRKTYERIGIPEAEKKSLSGVGAQYDSEIVYHNLKREWEDKGVIFTNMDVAVQKYPDLVRKHFMTSCVPINDHKFVMLHAAVWSGGTFIYVPKNVTVNVPLQAYFRMNAEYGGQFEHTLIIADEGSEVHYVEGCFTENNIVQTDSGYKKIKHIEEGDRVLTSEGVFMPAKDIQQYPYTGEVYTIQLYGDSTHAIEVTAEHPFLYVDRQRKERRNTTFSPRWNVPPFFKRGGYLALPINQTIVNKKEHTFTVIKGNSKGEYQEWEQNVLLTKEFCRLVGYYLAEGSVSDTQYLNFTFGMHETEYHKDVKQCLRKAFGYNKTREVHHKKNNRLSIVCYSSDLARLFAQFGTKSDEKQVPHWVLSLPHELQKEIIIGWFRGGGNYSNKVSQTSGWKKELFRINTTSEVLGRQGRDILLRLGIVGFLNRRERSHDGRKAMYTLGISGEHMIRFGKLVGIPIKKTQNGKRRASMFGITENFAFFPIKSITKRSVKNLPVYNFGVSEHETYTVSGVAVHNCSAPQFNSSSLHAGCVEIHVMKGAKVRYSSVENWSRNTYNLNTKRAIVQDDGVIEWVNGNMGSGCTMLYPCSVLTGPRARSDSLGIAFAAGGQNQDTGSKVIHAAPHTKSTIRAKSISKDGGISTYRGLVKVTPRAKHSSVSVECDALLVGEGSTSNTYPLMRIENNDVQIAHEATVGKIGTDEIFYLMSRGLDEEQARQMVVAGFIEPIIRQLPLEYAVELNKLIELEMEGSVG